jgi:hypothetical protein
MRKAVMWQYFQPFMRKNPKVFERVGFFENAYVLLRRFRAPGIPSG